VSENIFLSKQKSDYFFLEHEKYIDLKF